MEFTYHHWCALPTKCGEQAAPPTATYPSLALKAPQAASSSSTLHLSSNECVLPGNFGASPLTRSALLIVPFLSPRPMQMPIGVRTGGDHRIRTQEWKQGGRVRVCGQT
eukprot:967167-Pelagomonas_calceolata.AAC.1